MNRVGAYLVATFALSTIFYVRIVSAGKLQMLPTLGLMWCPGTAALIVRLASQRNLRGTGWRWGATRWQIVSYLLPPLAAALVYGGVWLTGLGGFSTAGLALGGPRGAQVPVRVVLLVFATIGMLQSVFFTLGEESAGVDSWCRSWRARAASPRRR